MWFFRELLSTLTIPLVASARYNKMSLLKKMLNGKPLFSGKNVVHQLDLMTDLLGSPPSESIARVAANYVAMVPSGQVFDR
ncbi:mitogen-activated protein kinase mpkC-like [Arachis ipaensis]|uniref:mitogen-activated protein kinase mpkC-like n=1 Tax=Arachis ipaensis TaxID=130454 RepID=UPI0007AF81B7|nr:mitogen-activated protein kinase mpkC-like [Arachis ipaensis]XP_025671969.1 mitogen-activated protein kinase mpkC [Arachis hypogaea]